MNPNVNRSQLVHIHEAAKALNLSVSNMYRLARNGASGLQPGIPSVRIGKRWLFDVDTIIKTMMRQEQPQVNRVAPQRAPSRRPVPDRLPQSPEQVMARAREVLVYAADAVHRAAEVMQLMDEVKQQVGYRS